MIKVMTVFGTRPEGIKMAPLVKSLREDKDINCVFVNTGQHKEMLDQVLDFFDVKADYNLEIMEPKQTLETVSTKILDKLPKILEVEKPDIVLVQGDTTTTFIAAYCAFLKQIPVGHIEAGLRTNNLYSPFPEEANRSMIGRIASYHFAATDKNRENLLKENIDEKNIIVTGNTVIDALLDATSRDFKFDSEIQDIINNGKKTIMLTTHRRENLDQLKDVYNAINQVLDENKDAQVIFPVHKNQKVRDQVKQYLNTNERVYLIEPASYPVFANLLKKAYLIITDSGGIQEEAPSLGVPVLVTRENTERPEGVTAGTLKLTGTNSDILTKEANLLLKNKEAYNNMSGAKNPYGDGTASKQIIEFIKNKIKK